MSVESIYKSIQTAKNGSQIPVFQSGKTMESRYNPERDADNLCAGIQKGSFFLVTGLGSGIFIHKLLEKFPESKILVLEKQKEDFSFLMQLESVKKLSDNPNVILCSIEDLYTKLSENYLPAKYGDLQIIEQRGWANENQLAALEIKEILKKTLSVISADYSVQAHFGRLWTHNIMCNSTLIEKTLNAASSLEEIKKEAEKGKTALIVAAGPGLDSLIKTIGEERQKNEIFVIATDTAWSSLAENNIRADAVVSIDGQSVSYNHFIHKSQQPVFFFDLCSNNSAARHVIESGAKTVFFCSGHPLAAALRNFSGGAIPCLFSGSGTVTITATDLAIKAGFKKIKIAGADFSYSQGKPYTKGTYLDTLYNMTSKKTQSGELSFSRLMYRTELKRLDQTHKTTAVLEAYRTSLENYLHNEGFSFKRENYIYDLWQDENQESQIAEPLHKLNYEPSKVNAKAFAGELSKSNPLEIETILLPYIAYLRHLPSNSENSYNKLLQLAFSRIVSYNI